MNPRNMPRIGSVTPEEVREAVALMQSPGSYPAYGLNAFDSRGFKYAAYGDVPPGKTGLRPFSPAFMRVLRCIGHRHPSSDANMALMKICRVVRREAFIQRLPLIGPLRRLMLKNRR